MSRGRAGRLRCGACERILIDTRRDTLQPDERRARREAWEALAVVDGEDEKRAHAMEIRRLGMVAEARERAYPGTMVAGRDGRDYWEHACRCGIFYRIEHEELMALEAVARHDGRDGLLAAAHRDTPQRRRFRS